MSNPVGPTAAGPERNAVLFANLVAQQAQMAMIFLGLIPNPETGKAAVDLEAARFFIDQMQMLQEKTKGNLTPDEAQVLQQGLNNLHVAYFQAAEKKGQ